MSANSLVAFLGKTLNRMPPLPMST